MNLKHIFENNLRGKEYLKARGLTPDTAMQGARESRRASDKLPEIMRLIENYQPADELRFVGAI